MKTLVVLSALTAVALAAPALLEEGSEDFKNIITNLPGTFKRERKSTQESSHISSSAPVASVNLPSTSQVSEFGVSGRSFGLKKPIIIKKKHGYHVYRDSDEEQAESGETCGKQVKVKLCDSKYEDMMSSTTIEDANMMEKDMKHSIQLAKEAVENLQRDLKEVKRIPGTKATAGKHEHSETDIELEQDIEVAREALEHIHKNFKNLESVRTTTMKEADPVQNVHFAIAKTEEQRLAQWKEAMSTIQKNVEIAKNIEESFKSASGETGLLFPDDAMADNNKHELNKMTDNIMRTIDDMVTKDENQVEHENCKVDHAHEKSSEKQHKKLIEDDMSPSASTISEKRMEDFHHAEKARHTSELSIDALEAHKEKDADMHSMTIGDLFQKDSLVSDSMKILEENKARKSEFDHKDEKVLLNENIDNVPASTNEMKSVESEDMMLERNAAANSHELQLHQSLQHDEHLKTMEVTEKQHPEMKSAEHFDQHLHELHTKEVDPTMFVKAAKEVPANMEKELLADTNIHEQTLHKDHSEQQFTEAKMASTENLKQQTEMVAPINNADQLSHQHEQSLLHPEMRTAEDLKHIHQHQSVDPSQTRWANDKDLHMQMESMKSADNIHSHAMAHAQNLQHPGHHHHMAHAMHHHNFETPSGHGQFHSRFPDNFMAQGKSADMDMQSYYMSMRDGSGVGPEGQRFRWKPAHDSSRSAYGPAASAAPSSGGAVGVFPNANVGGCGIPLLLSCNPSVVSGSLAKAHPAPYSAPAYRTEDDFNFHTKRDVKKTQDKLASPLHRTPASVNLKTSTV